MQIEHSVALVTGANRGIGRAFVEELLQRGARRVDAAASDVDTLGAVTRLDRDRVRPLQLDVRDPAAGGTTLRHDVTRYPPVGTRTT